VGPQGTRPLIFDAGALVQLERGNANLVQLIQDARQQRRVIIVPATVLAEVWRSATGTQVAIARLLKRQQRGDVQVAVLDELSAKGVGLLAAASGHDDVPDGHVAYLSLQHGAAPVLTQDPDDLRSLSPRIPIVVT
jgi:hypothetical protein